MPAWGMIGRFFVLYMKGSEQKTMRDSPHGIRLGELLAGRYRIVASLGSGGTSRVLLAEDKKLPGKRWAVKELYADMAVMPSVPPRKGEDAEPGGAGRRQAMLEEAETMSRLTHPSLPDIVDVVPLNDQGFMYLVMEYIDGETLQERFERLEGKMPAETVAGLALQLCGLLDYLHTSGPQPVIHRDLKPSNLMIDAEGRVRLIDFGTARRFKPGGEGDTVNLGTVGFAAPEQYDGRQSDPRTDLYGLGALMYYLLSGGAHYGLAEPPGGRRQLPPALEPIVLKLLKASPAERYATARETAAELGGWLRAGSRAALHGAVDAGQLTGADWTPPLVIAVGSLYAGAGATFVALALAQALEECRVPHAVIEPPSPSPELAALLFAMKNEPPHYRYYDAAMREPGAAHGGDVRWERGRTLWLPASDDWRQAFLRSGGSGRQPPDESGGLQAPSFAQAGAWFKLIHTLRRPVTIVDIGSRWEEPETAALLETVTDVVYVADPMVHKLQTAAVERRLRLLLDELKPGCRRHAVANKCAGGRAPWLELLPESPGCVLPALDSSLLAEAAWRGRLPTEHPIVWQDVRYHVHAWVSRYFPIETSAAALEKANGARLYRRLLDWLRPTRKKERREELP
ncbi:serine/threonine protein kinase [Paenibacillus sp. UNCCL117]|uniref:serine/threonine-protein kinase n=1 Tax=unclassified Paenibacillus TaxID=185978 RepID=UPI000888DAE9|nr:MULTISPECIES: serine/threonine-protein kinase [unclassified Paenibacillus]SDE40904.1 serine/threonine protein kinase [Paenibacillus sp. cl123]SFW65409.1 serine/threonine protein kinase [Paenibacillus sp. UNCCL117]